MPRATLLRGACLALAICLGTAAHAQFTSLICFGDSLTDSGNLYALSSGTLPPSPPYFDGRYSNGPLWIEGLADGLTLPAPTPASTGGRNWAFAGAAAGPGFSFGVIPNLKTQVDAFLSSTSPTPTDLVAYFGGANNIFNGQAPASVVQQIIADLDTLADAGARHFVVGNLPPLGLTPEYIGTPDEPLLNASTAAFNAALAAALDSFARRTTATVYEADVAQLFADINADPAAFGFTNLTAPALVNGAPVPNPDEYLFWDNIHPTRVAHAALASRALAAIPEPASASLAAVVAASLAIAPRQRRARARGRS